MSTGELILLDVANIRDGMYTYMEDLLALDPFYPSEDHRTIINLSQVSASSPLPVAAWKGYLSEITIQTGSSLTTFSRV